jgi:hypothetical protein
MLRADARAREEACGLGADVEHAAGHEDEGQREYEQRVWTCSVPNMKLCETMSSRTQLRPPPSRKNSCGAMKSEIGGRASGSARSSRRSTSRPHFAEIRREILGDLVHEHVAERAA